MFIQSFLLMRKMQFISILRDFVPRFKNLSDKTLIKKGAFPIKLVRKNKKSSRVSLSKKGDEITISHKHLEMI